MVEYVCICDKIGTYGTYSTQVPDGKSASDNHADESLLSFPNSRGLQAFGKKKCMFYQYSQVSVNNI